MQLEYIIHNHQLINANQPLLTSRNRGFRYGDGLFESMRMCDGKLMFAALHAERLQAGMKALKIEGGVSFDAYFLKQKTAELSRKNKLKDNARFRLSVYREGDGLYAPEGNEAGYILEGSLLTDNHYSLNKKGLIISIYPELTKQVDMLSNYKTSNSHLYVMAGLFKQQNRLDEAFILNQHGFLCESISSNIFVVYDKQIYTPALSEGCIAGVMRKAVMNLAKENKIPIIEAQINPEVLQAADEVFITNASSGIRWVMGYGRKRYFNEVTKSLSALLNAL